MDFWIRRTNITHNLYIQLDDSMRAWWPHQVQLLSCSAIYYWYFVTHTLVCTRLFFFFYLKHACWKYAVLCFGYIGLCPFFLVLFFSFYPTISAIIYFFIVCCTPLRVPFIKSTRSMCNTGTNFLYVQAHLSNKAASIQCYVKSNDLCSQTQTYKSRVG